MTLSQEIDKIFSEDKRIFKYLPAEIYDWAKSIILSNYKIAKNESAKQRIIRKIEHTQEVILAGLDIIENSKELNWNKTQAIIICFLHDIGRFEQCAIYDTFNDSISIDHGDLSSKLFQNKNFKIDKKFDCNESIISRSIKFHNKKEYKGKNIYIKLARDADKLALFRRGEILLESDIKNYSDGKLNPIILKSFLRNKKISNKIQKTKIDVFVFRGSWMWDLNFDITKKLVRNSNFIETLKKKISSVNIDQKTLNLIYQKIDKF